jgi:S1-C subfamily serine protease
MKRLIICLLTLLFVSPVFAGLPSDRQKDINKYLDEIFFSLPGCSGFLVNAQRKHIVTAAHCVRDDKKVTWSKREAKDGSTYSVKSETFNLIHTYNEVAQRHFIGKVIKYDPDKDVAVLELTTKYPLSQFGVTQEGRLFTGDVYRGQKVYAFGNPYDLPRVLQEGIISQLYDKDPTSMHRSSQLIQTTAGLAPGYSGGPVFDEDFNILGISSFGHRDNFLVGFAVSYRSIQEVLNEVYWREDY